MNAVAQFFNRQFDFSKILIIENPSIQSEYFYTFKVVMDVNDPKHREWTIQEAWVDWSKNCDHGFTLFCKMHDDMLEYWKKWKEFLLSLFFFPLQHLITPIGQKTNTCSD